MRPESVVHDRYMTTVGSRVVRDLANPLSGDFEDFSDFEAEKSTFFGLDGPESPRMRSRR